VDEDNMNRSDRNASVIAVLVAIAATLLHDPTWASLTQEVDPSAHANQDTKEIRISAKKYEYDPAVITVKQGDRVKLIVTAVDHDHGFKIEAFHIDQLVKKGESTSIEFSADMTGTFPFQCSHFCGLGHKGMKGELIVEEAPHASQEERLDASAEQLGNR
jgi:cytochrome c oxidase subunit II